MSAAPVFPIEKPKRTAPGRPPAVQGRHGASRARAKRKAAWLQRALVCLVLFGLTFVVTYGGSNLIGHSMKETARREALKATSRARSARVEVAKLRSRIERQTTIRAVEDWAAVRGFIAPYQVASAKGAAAGKPSVAKVKPKSLEVDVVVARADRGTEAQ